MKISFPKLIMPSFTPNLFNDKSENIMKVSTSFFYDIFRCKRIFFNVFFFFLYISSFAQLYEVDGFYYSIISSTSHTVQLYQNTYGGYQKTSYNIPSKTTINNVTYTVTKIADNAFSSCNKVTSIKIPNTVTSVGSFAFSNCSSLKTINIPSSITSIGASAFVGCTSLVSITFPNTIKALSNNVFQGCTKLETFSIPVTTTSVGDFAFEGCSNLTYISIPNSITSIGRSAFENSGLKSIVLGNSVKSIGNYAFSNCSNLKDLYNYVSTPQTSSGTLSTKNACKIHVLKGLASTFKATTAWKSYTIVDDIKFTKNIKTVDLGLPSGTLWANVNVGATSPEEYGDYFAWGEIVEKEQYSAANYVWCNGNITTTLKKYCTASEYGTVDNKTELELIDDAAYTNIGTTWRTPTEAQFEELISTCTWTWTTIDNVEGSLCTGPNGQTIFFPAGGYMTSSGATNTNKSAIYWTNTLNLESNSAASQVSSSGKTPQLTYLGARGYGRPIRAVSTLKATRVSSITLDKSSLSIIEGKTATLTTTVAPANATNKKVIWTSSNENVATVNNGIVTAIASGISTITATAADGSGKKVTCEVTVKAPSAPENIQLVDLGLPSGTLWANMNVGATSPEEYGDYFAWGETSPKETYTNANYEWYTNGNYTQITKYCTDSSRGTVDNRTTLAATDDAATVNWGSTWKTPSQAQCQELIYYCSFESAAINGISGLLVTGPNGNTLFFPYAGYVPSSGLTYADTKMVYWTNQLSLDLNSNAYSLTSIGGTPIIGKNEGRAFGRSVRAVSTTTAYPKPNNVYAWGYDVEIIPFAFDTNNSEVDVAVLMNNRTDGEVRTVDFDLYLPQGIALCKEEDNYKVDAGNRFASSTVKNQFVCNVTNNADESLHFHMYFTSATSEDVFSGTSGDIIHLPLFADANLSDGVFELIVKNIVFNEGDDILVRPYKTSIFVGKPQITSATLYGIYNESGMEALNKSLSTNSLLTSLDMTEASIKDGTIISLANKNALVCVKEGTQLANEENIIEGNMCDKLVLVDKVPFTAPKAFTAITATYTRALPDGEGWNSAVLPYEFDVTADVEVINNAVINGSSINFSEVAAGETVPANTPFLYRKVGGGTITIENVDVEIAPCETTPASGALLGTYVKIPAGEATGKLIMTQDGMGFATASALASIPAFRAYLNGGASSQVFTITVGDELTGIVGADANVNEKVDVYTLDGNLVRTQVEAITALQGLESGTYIINGNKIKK